MIFGHPVINAVPVYPPVDPLALVVYVTVFVSVSLVTTRQPAYGVCALILLEPFAFYHQAFDTTVTVPKVALLGVLLGVSVYPNALAPLLSKTASRVFTAGLLVLAATLLSLAHAAYHAPVIRESLKTVEYLLIFCAVIAAYRLDPDRRSIRIAVIWAAIAVAILALGQELVGAPSGLWINGHEVPRIAGPLEGPNQLAGYLDVALPLTLALAMDQPDALSAAGLFFIAFADFLTFSRGGLIAGAIACVVVAWILRRPLLLWIKPLAGGLFAGLLVVAAWVLQLHLGGLWPVFRVDDVESTYGGGVGTRSELWHAAIALWKTHKIFGIGAGNFELEIPLTGLKGVRTHANSLYLQSLVEGGIPLFAATLWLTYTSIAAFVRERACSPFVAAAIAGSVALMLHQIIDFLTFYPKVGAEWWILLALAAAELAVPATYLQKTACA